jgi:fermentation-respiration switch protein FrsA (DUF1100 family)
LPAPRPWRGVLALDPASLLPTGLPVTVMHDTRDQRVPVQLARDYVAAARLAGDPLSYTELPEADHFALIDPESTPWTAVVNGMTGLVGSAG